MKKGLIIAGISFVCFIVVFILIQMNLLVDFDNIIYNNIYSIHNSFFDFLFKWISLSCNTIPIIVLLFIVLFVLKKPYNYCTIFTVCFNVGVNQILKRIVRRVRPDHIRLVVEKGFSFPSGHAMVSLGLYGMIIYYIYKNVENKTLKIISILFLSFVILFIGISRIYVGVHYPSDVLAGYLLSFSFLVLIITLYNHYFRGKFNEKNVSN